MKERCYSLPRPLSLPAFLSCSRGDAKSTRRSMQQTRHAPGPEILLAPLALFSLVHLAQAGRYSLTLARGTWPDVFLPEVYFRPELLVMHVAGLPVGWIMPGPVGLGAFLVEATKWLFVLIIAIWLSLAQVAAWRGRASPGQGEGK